jgi:hypothetical protein
MTASDIAAWWGAVVASLVFFWELYKWWESGPKVRLTANANMLIYGDPLREGKKFVTVRAVNVGDAATTLTILGGNFYSSFWARLRRKPAGSFIAGNPGMPHSLPFRLEPGALWDGAAIQDSEVEEMAQRGYLILELHQAGRKPARARVNIKTTSKGPEGAQA